MILIQLTDIDKYLDKKLQRLFILKGISLTINEGDFVSIMGPSGAGKSTLLNVLGFLEDATDGAYHFLGKPVLQLTEKQKTTYHQEHIGFVFQAYHLIDELTVYENIEMPLLYRKVKRNERKGMVAEILDRFNMVAKKDLFPSQLSGGQQQLVGVARALVGNPTLILADEPTGNLHSDQSHQIMEWFQQLNKKGVTIIQVTHSEAMAAYGNRIIHMKDGMLVENNPYLID